MKVLKSFFLFTLVVTFISACKADQNTAFVKKWKVDAEATAKGLTEKQKKMFEESFEVEGKEMIDKFKAAIVKITMEFKKDGSFEWHNKVEGKWKLSEDGKSLFLTFLPDGAIKEVPIVESSASKLVVEYLDGTYKFNLVLIPE